MVLNSMQRMREAAGYIVIILTVVAVSAVGGSFTGGGMAWYRTLTLPSFTPPGSVIGMVWTVIYVLSAIAASLLWRSRRAIPRFGVILGLLWANAVLNALWSFVFFTAHLPGWAIVEMVVLNLTTLAIIAMSWHRQRTAAVLLVPYFAWVCFATYLAWAIWRLNG